MKIYRIAKKFLNFKEGPRVDFNKWKLPLIIDEGYNVLLGNLFEHQLPDKVLVIVSKKYKTQIESFAPDLEQALADENSEVRFHAIQEELTIWLRKCKTIRKSMNNPKLFEFRDTTVIDEYNYRKPKEYNFKKHSNKSKEVSDDIYDPDLYYNLLEEGGFENEGLPSDTRK